VIDLFLDAEGFKNWRCAIVIMQAVAAAPGNVADELSHSIERGSIIAHHLIDFLGEETGPGAFDQVWFLENAVGRRMIRNFLLDLAPLIEEEAQIANKITGALAFTDGANNHADSIRDIELAQNFSQAFAFLRIFNLARDAAAIAEWHENKVTPGETQVRGHARPLGSDRSFRHLDDDIRTNRINTRNIFCRDPFAMPALTRAVDFFDSTVERGWDGIPKMEESIFLEADVDEHRLQSHLDILDSAFVYRANNVARSVALDAIFFELSVFQERHAALQLFYADNQLVPRLARDSQKFSNFVDHK